MDPPIESPMPVRISAASPDSRALSPAPSRPTCHHAIKQIMEIALYIHARTLSLQVFAHIHLFTYMITN